MAELGCCAIKTAASHLAPTTVQMTDFLYFDTKYNQQNHKPLWLGMTVSPCAQPNFTTEREPYSSAAGKGRAMLTGERSLLPLAP